MLNLTRRGVSPVIAIVLLLMMTVAAAGAAYFWLTSMQSGMQKRSTKSIENIMEASGRRVTAQATLCKPTYPYEDLVGYWMMEGGSGNKTYDKSGNENTGTLYPGSDGEITKDTGMWTNGQISGGLKFDGNDSYVDIPNNFGIFDGSHDFTISLWFKTPTPGTDMRVITMRGERFASIQAKSDSLYFGWRDSSGTSHYVDTSQDASTWTYGTVTYSTEMGITLYQQGTEKASNSWTGTIQSTSLDSAIGMEDDLYYFNGTIDEVRIYDRALSKDEIKELYEAENHSARRRIDVTVRNIGSEEIPKATWVANLKQDGTTVETDSYNSSAIKTGELATLKFYFKNFKPNTEYTIELQGTRTSATVSC